MSDEFWLTLVISILMLTVITIYGLDKKQERYMAEKGYCYQVNMSSGNWQYQICK